MQELAIALVFLMGLETAQYALKRERMNSRDR